MNHSLRVAAPSKLVLGIIFVFDDDKVKDFISRKKMQGLQP